MTSQLAIELAINLPDPPAVAGLHVRPFDIGRDIEQLVDLICEANLADQTAYMPSVAQFRNDLEHHAYFDPGRDMLVAEVDGRLVAGTRHEMRVRDSFVQHQTDGWVQPDVRRRGVGRALLRWTERRAREAAAEWAGPEPHRLGSWVDETQPGAIALLESEGYAPVRYGFMMVRPLSEPIPEAPLPAGLEVRPVAEVDHRRIWDADTEAFRDHPDAAVRTEEDFVGWFSTPGIDTSLWRVAWESDEVAGSVMSFIYEEENEKMGVSRGWLDHVSVRRPWRRRGLASALIADSLRALRDRGLEQAALGVDSENPSGALGVYEALGFRRFQTGISFRKSL